MNDESLYSYIALQQTNYKPLLDYEILTNIENPSWLEYMGWYDHLWKAPLIPVNGNLKPTNRPGHGMDFKTEIYTL